MKRLLFVTFLAAYASAWVSVGAQQPAADGPRYVNGNQLARPVNYREWIFLGAGLDMTYPPPDAPLPPQQLPPRHTFTNVFVNPAAYRGFMQTGKWPNGTVLILEARRADAVSKYFPRNQNGQYQTDVAGIEANVKDSRFGDGWAFFAFNGNDSSTAPLAGDAAAPCVECHTKETAVERTFVQFYPTLLQVAREKGTLNPGFK
jgi:hypothetical protein